MLDAEVRFISFVCSHLHLLFAHLLFRVLYSRYYYDGCPSQTWFYPFHYTPLASDLVHVAEEEIEFVNSTPLLPFEQLIANLPPASSNFLPKPYAALMTASWSPILAWYPVEFEVDREGCRAPWEGVNLLPFISDRCALFSLSPPPLCTLASQSSPSSSSRGECVGVRYTGHNRSRSFFVYSILLFHRECSFFCLSFLLRHTHTARCSRRSTSTPHWRSSARTSARATRTACLTSSGTIRHRRMTFRRPRRRRTSRRCAWR